MSALFGMAPPRGTDGPSSLCAAMLRDLASLGRNPRELWFVLLVSLTECLAMFLTLYVLAKYLSDVLGYTDIAAGAVFGCMTGFQLLLGLLMSPLLDRCGVRACLCIGGYAVLIARCMVWLCSTRLTTGFALCILWPAGAALIAPALMIGVKRYTSSGTRSTAFGLYYVSFNVSSFGAAIIVNLCRRFAGAEGQMYGPVLGVSACVTAVGVLISHLFRDIAVDDETSQERTPVRSGSGWENAKEVCSGTAFWRFIAVISLFVLLRMMFGHLKATVPKWMTREFGEGTPYELYIGLNAFLIILLVPVLSFVTKAAGFSIESVMITGAWISGLSPSFLAFLPASETGMLAFIVAFSVGEALWSPKLYEYAASVPREGVEGIFAVLSKAPVYLAKFLAGVSSGFLLAEHCPAPNPKCNSSSLWSAILFTSVLTPLSLAIARPCLFAPTGEAEVGAEKARSVACGAGEAKPLML
eukprot:TRINITY_DN50646_c0_g1_i1.p1 TRINITY_DN50646_c0_g1~~TRINITY_DN50646_c0_g1_i1.p1  ORF type:complete len:470 (+),score=51.56 TRINITY_DN50646_c0_g1_i1:116-1525(+)